MSCGSRRTKLAWKITDAEMADAVSRGYEIDEKLFLKTTDEEAEAARLRGETPGITPDGP